ncbi:MAG: MFS transporter [Rickettsiaceae bacterium]|nr:MFS transporter [Rickettsiaceae bacterium]
MNDDKKNNLLKLFAWITMTIFYCYQYVLRIMPNIIMPDMVDKFNIGASEYGSFGSIYYIGYSLAHIPVGLFLSRFSARIVLPICIILTGVGLVPVIYTESWNGVLWGRVITGIGSCAAAVGAIQVFRIVFPNNFTKMLGFMVFTGLVFAKYGGDVFSNTLHSIGLSAILNILLYAGLILSVITYFLMPKSTEEVSHHSLISDIKAVLFNPRILFVGMIAGLMLGPLEGFADVWGSAFLINVYEIEKIVADKITNSIMLGMAAGCIILPYIAEKFKFYYGTVLVSAIVMFVAFIYILNGNSNENILYYVSIIIGVFCAYQVIMIAKITTFVSEERSGIAGAMANMFIMIFGSIYHKVIGGVIENHWDGATLDDVKVYSDTAYINGVVVIPVGMGLAIIGIFVILIYEFMKAKRVKTLSTN